MAAYQAISQMPDSQVVMFVDAFDVVLSQPASVILERFLATRETLLFSAEKGCWPFLDGWLYIEILKNVGSPSTFVQGEKEVNGCATRCTLRRQPCIGSIVR